MCRCAELSADVDRCWLFWLKAIAWLLELCDIAGQSQPGVSHTMQEAQECEQERKKLESTAEVLNVTVIRKTDYDTFSVLCLRSCTTTHSTHSTCIAGGRALRG